MARLTDEQTFFNLNIFISRGLEFRREVRWLVIPGLTKRAPYMIRGGNDGSEINVKRRSIQYTISLFESEELTRSFGCQWYDPTAIHWVRSSPNSSQKQPPSQSFPRSGRLSPYLDSPDTMDDIVSAFILAKVEHDVTWQSEDGCKGDGLI